MKMHTDVTPLCRGKVKQEVEDWEFSAHAHAQLLFFVCFLWQDWAEAEASHQRTLWSAINHAARRHVHARQTNLTCMQKI